MRVLFVSPSNYESAKKIIDENLPKIESEFGDIQLEVCEYLLENNWYIETIKG